jgi:4-carboxymuconolactone decarboxylase
MSDSTKRKKGMEMFEKVLGFVPPDPGGDSFLETTVDHLFANVWAAPGLSVRERRLVTLTVLAQIGNESVLKLHAGAALDSGDISDESMDALVIHLAHYAGWPPAAILATTLRTLRAKRS